MAYETIHKRLKKCGCKPSLQVMDNEVSEMLMEYHDDQNIKIQLAPPNMHRRNAAERAIRTWKDHFIAIRATCDTDFPERLWCRLVPHTENTLNLMRATRIQPKISAFTLLHGAFNYERTPIAPAGMKIIIHDKPKERGSWQDRGTTGWYIGMALNHFRCHTCYVPQT